MSESFHLRNPPVVEAVIEIECDTPPERDFASLEEAAKAHYLSGYPKFTPTFEQLHEISGAADGSLSTSMKRTLDAFRFFREDGKQLVQVRRRGFTFNQLAPYPGLNAFRADVEEAWRAYLEIAAPRRITKIQLRYINRILLPLSPNGQLDLDEYLRRGPRLADEDRLTFVGFLSQYAALDRESGHLVVTVLTTQPPEDGRITLIFDNSAIDTSPPDPTDWPAILGRIHSLRGLKNHVFRRTLTDKCLSLFQ